MAASMQYPRPRTASGYGRQSRSAPHRRSGRRGGKRGDTRPRASSPVRRTLFHAPSFSAGVVLGAVVVLGAAYLPELLPADGPAPTPAPEVRPRLTFEFDELLRNSQVTADPEPYASVPATEGAASDELILLQAASFRSREDAERLRAALLLMDLPAATSGITLASGHWYRVTVGPFDSRLQAQRALTRLREQDIAAIWTKTPAR